MAGCYMIKCQDTVFKIGCSNNLSNRLSVYPGLYWDVKILNIWPCTHPKRLEYALHLFVSTEC